MKKSVKVLIGIIIALAVACGIFAFVHLSSRDEAKAGVIIVEADGKTVELSIPELELEKVEGTTVNGKGEEKQVLGDGILLMDALDNISVSVNENVNVYADDEYSAEVSVDELRETGQVYLLVEENQAMLTVFGDKDSKRNVKNVLKIVVK